MCYVVCCIFVVVKLLVFRCLVVVIPGLFRMERGGVGLWCLWGVFVLVTLVSEGVLWVAGEVGADVGDDGVYEALAGGGGGP